MARRKQLKGIAGNIGQWCLSRNFDYEGYWALGQFFAHTEANGTDEVVIKVIEEFVPIYAEGIKFSSAIKLLSSVLKRDIKSNNIPDWWLKDVSVIFRFNTDFEHKYHYHLLHPFSMMIATDIKWHIHFVDHQITQNQIF